MLEFTKAHLANRISHQFNLHGVLKMTKNQSENLTLKFLVFTFLLIQFPVNGEEPIYSLLSKKTALVDIKNSRETPTNFSPKDREVRLRAVFDTDIGCPRYETWRTGITSETKTQHNLSLALKEPLSIGTIISFSSQRNTETRIKATDDAGNNISLPGNPGSINIVAPKNNTLIKQLDFQATKLAPRFDNRFTHSPKTATHKSGVQYNLSLEGIYLFPERWKNISPYAEVAVEGTGIRKEAEKDTVSPLGLNDMTAWKIWRSKILKPGKTTEIKLTWPVPVKAEVIGFLIPWNCFTLMPKSAEFMVKNSEQKNAEWISIADISNFNNDKWKGKHLYLIKTAYHKTFSEMKVIFTPADRQIAVGELLVLSKADDNKTLDSIDRRDDDRPPVTIPFKIPEPGKVTLVIEDKNGKRIKNLIANVDFNETEKCHAYWDGATDSGRSVPPDRKSVV